MRFTRLRLAGFKSFVDGADFPIEPGLTGIVGPNGCGKSNLFESLRWVMGANSAKALRGEGMDDVIFAGAEGRPARNRAEVSLHIDNSDHSAPAQFNLHSTLEVTRRIDRGEGSTFLVNGAEVRARDVQLLFADASSGANSPALVRQGQISELIAARPQNRRRILEEAAGVAGLHGRRHEAELKVAAAQANLDRVEDLARELETTLGRLRRESRAAARYKVLTTKIRDLREALVHRRWREAADEAEAAAAAAETATAETAGRAGEAARAQAAALAAEEAVGPLRAEEAGAAAVLHRLAIEKDRLDRDSAAAASERERLAREAARLEADLAREAHAAEDCAAALARLARERETLESAMAADPDHLPRLRAEAAAAEAARGAADAAVERLATLASASEVEARAARGRLESAHARLTRLRADLEALEREAAAIGAAGDDTQAAEEAGRALAGGLDQVARARAALAAAEEARAAAGEAEEAARDAWRRIAERVSTLEAEAEMLGRLIGPEGAEGAGRALDHLAPDPGYEAAVAAALGDEAEAELGAGAARYWAGAEAPPPEWPAGAGPLGGHLRHPRELATRLAYTALVEDASQGARLQKRLPPGARLVSRAGDLWRWDGYTAAAGAAGPAQARLEQRTRRDAVERELQALRPQAETLGAAHAEANAALARAEAAVRNARAGLEAAEAATHALRAAAEAAQAEANRREARRGAVAERLAWLRAQAAEATTEGEEAAADAAAAEARHPGAEPLLQARGLAAEARERAAQARAAQDAAASEQAGRQARLAAVSTEEDDWSRRAERSRTRTAELEGEQAALAAAAAEAEQAPLALKARELALLETIAGAESRRKAHGDALAAAEAAHGRAEGAFRQAQEAASQARERRAAAAARLELAERRAEEEARALTEATGLAPEALSRRLAEGGEADSASAAELEHAVQGAERERDSLGAVNLRAEEEAQELAERVAALDSERADLAGALRRLGAGIAELNAEGRERLLAAFDLIDGHFRDLFAELFQGGEAQLRLVESDDPLEAGLEILACPPGKRLTTMSLMSGGEQALTALALIFAVFLANPAPVCFLDEVDAPLDDANIERFCALLDQMRHRATTRFIAITHNPLTMSRMDRLFGVTMSEPGVSQLLSVDLRAAEAMAAQ